MLQKYAEREDLPQVSVFMNEDLRSIKTQKALFGAMLSVLKRQSFKKITVKGICEEALISRAAFYAHFIDKYDLLSRWLTELWGLAFGGQNDFRTIEDMVNQNIGDITRVLKNLVCDADSELFGIMYDLILSTKNPANTCDADDCCKSIAKANFYVGGILSYLSWQIKNKFPVDVPLINRAIFDMVCEFRDK